MPGKQDIERPSRTTITMDPASIEALKPVWEASRRVRLALLESFGRKHGSESAPTQQAQKEAV